MTSALSIICASPLKSIVFLYSFIVQCILIILHRALVPDTTNYQSFRTQCQRAWYKAAGSTIGSIINYTPSTHSEREARRIDGKGWKGYLIPGTARLEDFAADNKGGNGKKAVILFSHGGGYAWGEARMYVGYMNKWIKAASQQKVELVFLSLEYPLSGEASFPAQVVVHQKAYQYLQDLGIPYKRIVFMGDSAGGDLSILSGISCLEKGTPQPAATILISPWIDFSLRAYQGGNALVETDYVNANAIVPSLAKAFIGDSDYTGRSPEVNPLYRRPEELQGLSPQLIFAGGGEFALRDSQDWAALLDQTSVPHELIVEWGMMHVYALGSLWIPANVRHKTEAKLIEWIRKSTS